MSDPEPVIQFDLPHLDHTMIRRILGRGGSIPPEHPFLTGYYVTTVDAKALPGHAGFRYTVRYARPDRSALVG